MICPHTAAGGVAHYDRVVPRTTSYELGRRLLGSGRCTLTIVAERALPFNPGTRAAINFMPSSSLAGDSNLHR